MKLNNLFKVFLLVASLAIFTIACEGPEGPAGPAGTDGEDGADGTQSCTTCHGVSTDLAQKIYQWEHTMHANGETWYERGTIGSCAACHSAEGFRQLAAGEEVTAPKVSTNLGCRGCHNIHVNFDMTDFEPIIGTPVALVGDLTDGQTVDGGTGNLCINCHQSRERGYDWAAATMNITSTHWGPHHGTQGIVLFGTGLYDFGQDIESSGHASMVDNSCVDCHMVDGGHAFEPVIAACEGCHSGAEDFDINGFQTEYDALFKELQDLLITEGLVDGDEEHGYHPVPTDGVDIAKAGALWNWAGLLDDGSRGVHNPKYVKGILEASIDALK